MKRPKRADGHLRKIISMIEEGRSCLDVAQQMAAVESAAHQAKQVFIRDHIDNCFNGQLVGGPEAQAAMTEFKAITKHL